MTNLKSIIAKAGAGLMIAAMMFGSFGSVAQALTQAEATAIIAALGLSGSQAAAIQALVTGGSTTTTGTMSGPALTLGSKGAMVTALQQGLVAQGHLTMPAGVAYGYFGALTKTAVAKWQAANGVAPAAGYFGPKSMAAWNAMGGTVPPVTPSVPTTGMVTAMLAGDNPASAYVVAGQATADLAHFVFSNGTTSEVKITNVTLKRTGLSADADVSNLYLFEGNNRLTDGATISSNVINFNDPTGLFSVPANSSKTIAVKADLASSMTGTLGITMTSFTKMGDSSATTVSLSGNTFSGQSVSNFGGASFATTTYPTASTAAPQDDYEMWKNTVTITNNDVWFKSIKLRQIGSVLTGDLKNFELYVDGVMVGSVVPMVDAQGYAFFDMSANPVKLKTGNREIKVLGDIISGSSRTFSFSLRQASDAVFTDAQYGANVLAQANNTTFSARTSTSATIDSGVLTFSKKTDSPSGNVVDGASGVILARYDVKASGEKMKVETLRVRIDEDDADTAYTLRNGVLYLDGTQVGSMAAIAGDTDSTQAYTEYSFGSSFVVEPGITRVLEIRADVYDNDGGNNVASGDTMQVEIVGSSNVQRMTSLTYDSYPGTAVEANTLTVSTGSLTGTKVQGYGNQTVVAPQTAYLLGKFTVTGNSSEVVNLNTITVALAVADAFAVGDLTDLYVKYGSKTTAVKATGAASQSWSISEQLPINGVMDFEVYGTINATATNGDVTPDTVITSLTVAGTGSPSTTALTTGAVTGQTVTATSGGTLTVTLDSGTPVASIAVAGSTPAGATKVKLVAANETVNVKTVSFRVDSTTDDAVIASATLWKTVNGVTTQVSTSKTWDADTTNPGFVTWTLTGSDRIEVQDGQVVYLTLKPTFVASNQQAATGQTPRFYLSNIEAEGTTTYSAQDTDGSDLVVETGILIGGATPTFAADGTATTYSGFASTTATTLTVNVAPTTDRTGSFAFIDVNADATYDNGTEEIVYVSEGTTGDTSLVIVRGALGTTAVNDAAGNIYFLTGINGNAITVLEDKLTLSVASDSPTGSTTGSTNKLIFKFTASAANNAEDTGENKVSLTSVDLTTTKSGLTVNNVKLYPSEYDQNATYLTTCVALSQTKWRCTLSSTGSTNEIVENTSRSYVVRADVGSGVGTSNTLDVSIASLGSSSVAGVITSGDVTWSDNTTSTTWVDQPVSYVQPSNPLTLGASSGTTDSTAPTISSIVFTDGTADNALTIGATIVITFSERMDPSSIGPATMVPGGSAVAVSNAATGDISVAGNNGAASTNDMLTITGIANIDLGANTFATGALTGAVTAALDSTGTILTLTVTSALTGAGADGTEIFEPGSAATTMEDANGNNASAAGSNSATVTGVDL